MAQVVAEAVLIKCADGLGQLTTYANSAIGLAGGYIAAVTGYFGLNGSKTITGDTAVTVWYEDLLAEGDGDFLPSRGIDLVEGGNLEEVSAMSFTFLNTNGIAALLEANGVSLQRCEVRYFRVTTSDFSTFNFRQRWFGVIDDQPFTETRQQIQCVSSDKAIYKSAPVIPIDSTTFPKSPTESRDKFIPIAFGRVGFAPLINVKGAGEKTVLNKIGGVNYTATAANYLIDNACQLKTNGVVFYYKDVRLTGRYLSVIIGGAPQMVRITLNYETDVSDPANYYTLVLLEEIMDTSGGGFVQWEVETPDPGDPETWFFEVVDATPTLLLSSGPVYQIKKNAQGRPILSTYSKDLNAYEDVSEANITASTSNIDATGFPGYSVLSKAADQDGDLINFFNVAPKDIKVVDRSSWTTNDIPAVGASAPLLFDRDESAGHYYTLSKTSAITWNLGTIFDIYLPDGNALKKYEDLFVLFDLSHVNSPGTAPAMNIRATVTAFDFFGRQSSILVNNVSLTNAAVGTTESDFYTLPRGYFGTPGDAITDSAYYAGRTALSVGALLDGNKAGMVYNRIRITISHFSGGFGTYTMKLKELGLVGKIKISTGSDSLYGSAIGEVYGSTWNGRKIANQPVERPQEVIEKIVRDVNGVPLWVAKKVNRKGDRIRSSADNGHLFQCTTAGTSGTSEPAWTGTAAATYTDGGAVWKEVGTVPIDEASIDALNVNYVEWRIGYSAQDPKPTEEWVRMLCRHAWIAAITDRFGKVKLKAFLDTETISAAFDKTNIYGKSLRGGITYSAMSRVYNLLRFSYDWNPAAKKYNRQIAIRNVDKPAFPTATETVSTGVSLGAFTASAVELEGGIQVITIVTIVLHGMQSGDYADLVGNADGYSFSISPPVSITDSYTFKVLVFGHAFTSPTSTTGQLTRYTNRRLAWMDYVSGIRNYATAKSLWDSSHAGFMEVKGTKEMPEDLGDLPFFFDPYALDANGALLWPDLNVGDGHAAVFHAQRAVQWLPYPKPQAFLEVVDDGTFDDLEVADRVTLNEDKLSGGVAADAWICKITPLPKTKDHPHRIQFGLIFRPGSLGNVAAFDTIDEFGATNYLDEQGATDYVEDVVT